jgi:2-isopropylmalate synthase
LKYKLRKSRQQVLEEAVAAVELARRYADDVEFSAEDATRTDPDYLEQVSLAVVEAGAGKRSTCRIRWATRRRDEHAELIGRMVRAFGDRAIVSVHCHDDLGLAVANSLAAVQAGARQVECTINGIGERAGNCSLEEVVMAMRVRQDRLPFETAIVTEQLVSGQPASHGTDHLRPAAQQGDCRRNAFAHEAGIHQDGFLKERTTYEIMDPRMVGVPESRLVLGKHSGRHALNERCQHLGFELSREELDQVYQALHRLADRKKGVRNEEIVDACSRQARRPLESGAPRA